MGQKVLVTPIIGYGFGITGDAWTTDSKVYTLVINGQDTTMPYFDNYTQHLVSFSGKLRMGLGLGYKLNKNITTGLDFYYVGGRKVEFTISDELSNLQTVTCSIGKVSATRLTYGVQCATDVF